MIDQLATTAKQVSLELIDLSETVAQNMQTWDDVLAQNPESVTATLSAGFITKPSVVSGPELVIDVQAPPQEEPVLRTWAIHTATGDDHQTYFNNIQLTYRTDSQRVQDLIAKGAAVTREDIRSLLQDEASHLAAIAVSNQSAGDGAQQTHGEKYEFTVAELAKRPDDVAAVGQALQIVLQTLKQSVV